MDSINRKLAVFYLGSIFYLGSFHFWWDTLDDGKSGYAVDLEHWSLLVAPIIFVVFSIWAWWNLGLRRNNDLSWRREGNSAYIGTIIVILSFLLWFNFSISPLNDFSE